MDLILLRPLSDRPGASPEAFVTSGARPRKFGNGSPFTPPSLGAITGGSGLKTVAPAIWMPSPPVGWDAAIRSGLQ